LDISDREAPRQTLLFSHRADMVTLSGEHGRPRLPDRLVPLAEIEIRETVSHQTVLSINQLQTSGVEVVLLAGADPVSVSEMAASLGVDRSVNLARQTPADRAAGIQPSGPGAGLLAEVTNGPGELGHAGGGGLAIALRGASPAALAEADVVLVEDSLRDLPRLLRVSRRIVNGVMAMLKLNLSYIATQLGLLFIVLASPFRGFVYTSAQSDAITLFAISVPSVFLLRLASSRRAARVTAMSLVRFVLPTAVATVGLVAAIFLGFRAATGNLALAQLATTWVLVAVGLLRMFFAVPSSRIWSGGEALVGDARVYGLAGVSAALFVAAVAIPLSRRLLELGWLPSVADYAVLGVALMIWGAAQLAFWRWLWPDRLTASPARSAEDGTAGGA
jgi:hypothetical protein